ncbi:MAG: hypothetical protein AB6733_23970 [Clostridiaceae bacterium]
MDYRKLQEDLKDYFSGAISSGLKLAVTETINVERASESELLKLARNAGLDLRNYED